MTQPIDIISGSLRSIGALESGETPEPASANDALVLLNDMLDSWSNEKLMVFCVQELIHELTANQYIYTVGPGGMIGSAFTGSIAGNLLTVTAIASGALSVGQTISGTGVTAGTSITALGTAIGGNAQNGVGTYQLNLPSTVVSSSLTSTAVRPIRINSGFVRVVNAISGTLDYPIAILSSEEYECIGIKTLPGPWPRAVYYQPSEPTGTLYYWQNPSQGEMHLFCDTVLNRFQTMNDTVTLPPGYLMALRWNLAELLLPEYGKADPSGVQLIQKNAAMSKGVLKRSNMNPQQAARFDDMMVSGRRKDAGWVISGGYT
jgi:hypothetical protein